MIGRPFRVRIAASPSSIVTMSSLNRAGTTSSTVSTAPPVLMSEFIPLVPNIDVKVSITPPGCLVCKHPVRKVISRVNVPEITKPLSVSDAKAAGFTVLERRDKGVYEKL